MSAELIYAWITVLATLAIYSFLYKDNPIYKFAEHVFVGMAVGYTAVIGYSDILRPDLVNPLYNFFFNQPGMEIPDRESTTAHVLGEIATSYEMKYEVSPGWRIIALVFVILFILRLNKKYAWLSRWPLALMVGAYAGLRLTGETQAKGIVQIIETMMPLWPTQQNGLAWSAWVGPSVLTNWLIVLGVIACLIHFFFSVEQKGPLKAASRFGILILMITFGAHFGYTVLARISLLIGRVDKLQTLNSRENYYPTLVIGAALVTYFVGMKLYERARSR